MEPEVIEVSKHYTRAQFTPGSYNDKENSVDVVFATESTDVQRYDWTNDTDYIEVLVCDPSAVRMKRVNNGAPLLNAHDRYELSGVIGVVVKGTARIENKQCLATIRFSSREDVKPIIQDVKDGILTGISVGYEVYKYEREPIVDGQIPTYRAIDWEPVEISLVPVPADPDSGVRSKKPTTTHPVQVTGAPGKRTQEPQSINHLTNQHIMDLKARALAVGLKEDATEAEIVAAERKKSENDAQQQQAEAAKKAAENERARTKSITSLCRTHNLSADFIDKLVEDGTSIEDARTKILDELAKNDPKFRSNVTVTGKDEQEKQREGKIASLVIRSAQVSEKEITKEERELASAYRGMSLMDLAKLSLEAAGEQTRGLDKMDIAKRSITNHTSDFPVLLEGVNRRVLLAAYRTTPDTWRQFCAIGSVGDFREYKRLRWGSLTRLDALGENSEYKNKKINDAEFEKISAGTFGNTINISRQMIINDDLGAFTRLTAMLGRAAARSIEIDVYSLLAQNSGAGPTMQDGKALFHVDHKNLVSSGGAPGVSQFDSMRQLMALQTDTDNNDYLDIRPSIWLGPISLDGTAKVVNGSIYDPDASNKLQKPNMVNGMFENIVGTPRLTGAGYYAFADPSLEPVFEVAFLDGNQNPYLESEMPFDIDGVRWKVRLDYGTGAVGWRGAVKNPGA